MVHCAATWCRMNFPPPSALISSQQEHVWTTRPEAAQALFHTWTKIFGNSLDLLPRQIQFLSPYRKFVRPSLLVCGPTARASGCRSGSAGWAPKPLWWPEGQCHRRCVVFLPKTKEGFTKTTEVRPTAISSIIYRPAVVCGFGSAALFLCKTAVSCFAWTSGRPLNAVNFPDAIDMIC